MKLKAIKIISCFVIIATIFGRSAAPSKAQPPVFATIIRPDQRSSPPRTRGLSSQPMPQPGIANNPDPPPTKLEFPRTRGVSRDAILNVYWKGVVADLAGKYQWEKLRTYLGMYNDAQIMNLAGLLGQSRSEVEQVFLLKSFIAGEPWQHLLEYSAEMRNYSQDEIIRRSTMRDDPDLIQQWQDSCGPSMLQTVAGETDPRFAWELNKLGNISAIDPFGGNRVLAEQQKQWLEENGGIAVPRGQTGRGIPITEFLNKSLGPIVGATYVCQTVSTFDFALHRIAELLQNGYDVPVCLAWDETGGNNHFVVLLSVRGTAANRAFHIHDTWTGKSAWVSETSIRQNRLSPIFDNFAKLTHYYEAFPK